MNLNFSLQGMFCTVDNRIVVRTGATHPLLTPFHGCRCIRRTCSNCTPVGGREVVHEIRTLVTKGQLMKFRGEGGGQKTPPKI